MREEEAGSWDRLERVLVAGVVAHSSGVGLFLALAPLTAVAFAGFGSVAPVFFARQAGVFHLVLAVGYLAEYHRARGVVLLLVAKGSAVVFLAAALLGSSLPWSVPVSAALDGLMGLAVALAHRGAEQARKRRLALAGIDGACRSGDKDHALSDATGWPDSSS